MPKPPKPPKQPQNTPPPSRAADTAESFLDEESRAVLGMPETFQGNTLAPYSEGVRLMWLSLFSNVSGSLMAVGLIWMMHRLQVLFDASEALSNEERWEEAGVAFMRECGDVARVQFRVMKWAGEIGRKGTAEAVSMANRILDTANKTDIARTDDDAPAEGDESGNAQSSRASSPSGS